LRELEGGLIIIRRRKHEFDPQLQSMTPQQRSERTNKVFGSKFNSDWTPDHVTNWIARQVAELGWTYPPGTRRVHDVEFSSEVGLVSGHPVHTIRLVCDGRYLHAYPVRRPS
jgi:hypothetical protein